MRQRWRLILGGLVMAIGLGVGVAIVLGWRPRAVIRAIQGTEATVRVGLIHSQSGALANSEKSLIDAEMLAIDEINADGGVAGRRVVPSAPDCRSDPATFADQARRLIDEEKVVALFGCWTSECRKAVIPVVEERTSLLFYPGNFEGIERSPRVVYVGGAANQTILPAVRWACDSLKARRFFLIGFEEVWSRCSAEIAKDGIKAAGGEVVGESFAPPTASVAEVNDSVIEQVRRLKPDVVLNFLCSDRTPAFYAAIRRAGFTAESLPVIGFGFGEDEARRFAPGDGVGHYVAANYLQSLDGAENRAFVRRFRARFGENRPVGDAMVAAYNGVKFWAQAGREARTTDVAVVANNLTRQSINAPDGVVTIDGDSRSVRRPMHVGRLRADGQFEIVWSIPRSIRPVEYVATRSGERWRDLLESYHRRWGGRWSLGAATTANPKPPTTAR